MRLLTVSFLFGSTLAQRRPSKLPPFCTTGNHWSDGNDGSNTVANEPRLLQKPLGHFENERHIPHLGGFTKAKQEQNICASAQGESQWTGEITVGDDRTIFYWFFDSRNDPANDPIILWMQGGPGGSSMYGLFSEMGPCWLNPDTQETESNPWSWNNNASLLFIDQPAGSGLSHLGKDKALPYQEEDTAEDFQQFLNIFFTQAFPDKKHLPLHIATESYGGKYGPVYLSHILKSREYNSMTAYWGEIRSLILVSALIDWVGTFVGTYELLCKDREAKGILNATACAEIARNLPEQERLGQSCSLAYTRGEECAIAHQRGDAVIHAAYKELVRKGERHPANIHKKCVDLNYPQCLDPSQGNLSEYLNRPEVKKALGKPASFEFEMINRPMFNLFGDCGSIWKPTTRELAYVLDAYQNSFADIKVLVMNGNDDFGINTPGNIWQYDRLAWSGQAEYRIKDWEPLVPGEVAATGFWKATSDGRLAFVAIDGAGHPIPGDVQEGSYRILQKWLNGEWKMM